ncbi:MarR family transcriptional regulator [Stutzerimonas stutzeri]|uniref:MarR family transcriptional regulator n=1 Tax=Stutzerimonas stutzeri TaxID=316 RepID=W8RR92_STUST|nr:MarR family transcriptional regulator [Stutzerimonas stutzeri]AHL74531.1 MarR family transcriptional regulator [Stutzerimonas stutzeri]MCQ4329058.1 MarR family transcriptional regulator [Stutzerimonas stutzeri]
MTTIPSDEQLQLDNQLCFALHSASLQMTKTYKPLLQSIGLTYPQYLAMLVLWERDGLTVGEISARLLTEPGSLTPLLKRLEAEGLINRTRSSHDERVVELHLTNAGRDLKERARDFPGCMLECTGQSPEALLALRNQLVSLRRALLKSS